MSMRTKTKLVYGVGINDISESTCVNGDDLPYVIRWRSMLSRCYSSNRHTIQHTYIGCSVCEEWKLLSNFKAWYDENYRDGFALDKDILFEGNKVYGPETCRFVPRYINNLVKDHSKSGRTLPVGVSEAKPNKSKCKVNLTFQARCENGVGSHLTKTFKTIEAAQEWYRVTKTRVVKEQAQRAFLENAIKSDVYLALVRRKF